MTSLSRVLAAVLAMAPVGCGANDDGAEKTTGGAGGGGSTTTPFMTVQTDTISLDPGFEDLSVCQSWSFDNTEDVWIDRLEMHGTQGWHHSDWYVIPEDVFPGSGKLETDCKKYGFDFFEVLNHGELIYIQSTQSTTDSVLFAPGAALRIPPGHKFFMFGHVLNPGTSAVDADLTVDLYDLPADEVTTEINDFGGSLWSLDIPPNSKTRISSDCTFTTPPEWSVYYVTPHYHGYGVGMKMEILGGPNDGKVFFDSAGSVGEPLGRRLDEPVDMTGATGFRYSCTWHNTSPNALKWGSNGDDEMCFYVMHTSSPSSWYSTTGYPVDATMDDLGMEGDVHHLNAKPCIVVEGGKVPPI